MWWRERKNRRCPHCGKVVSEKFKYCPYCGERLLSEFEEEFPLLPRFEGFESIFREIEREFERLDRMLSSRSSFFSIPRIFWKGSPRVRGGGISITIHSATGKEPRVEVKTFGDYKRFEPEIRRRLGIPPKGVVEEEETLEEKVMKAKVTEEPEAKVERKGKKRIITIELPGVKASEDVNVKRLEQSIEVRAFAGDKAYFKLIPIPKNASVEYKFEDEKLVLEVEEGS